jgi:hypothetical protein
MIPKEAMDELQDMVFSVAGKLAYMSTMTQAAAGAMGDEVTQTPILERTEEMLIGIASDMREGASAFEDVVRAIHAQRMEHASWKEKGKNEEEPQPTEG